MKLKVKLEVTYLNSKVDRLFVETHDGVDVHTCLFQFMFAAEAKGVLDVVAYGVGVLYIETLLIINHNFLIM